MSKMSMILKGLVDRTDEGKLTWRSSVDENVFITAVDAISIAISSIGSARDLKGIRQERYRLEIQNDEGITVEVLETPDYNRVFQSRETDATAEESEELRHLFILARRSALNADLTLDKLANSLSSF